MGIIQHCYALGFLKHIWLQPTGVSTQQSGVYRVQYYMDNLCYSISFLLYIQDLDEYYVLQICHVVSLGVASPFSKYSLKIVWYQASLSRAGQRLTHLLYRRLGDICQIKSTNLGMSKRLINSALRVRSQSTLRVSIFHCSFISPGLGLTSSSFISPRQCNQSISPDEIECQGYFRRI